MFVFTLIVIGLLCLAFKSTRLTGVVGLTLLSLIYVWLFLALLVLGCVGLYLVYYKRSRYYVLKLSKLFTRSSRRRPDF